MPLEQQEVVGELKVAQQHLANERTFLAWIRTAVSIVGIGFLATSLHFAIGNHRNTLIDFIAILLGICSCLVGILTTVIATISYNQKKRHIQCGVFVPTKLPIAAIVMFLIILFGIVVFYFLCLYA
ncbi:YidH family protein [Camelliibacillus cellulosilyticus]|uniref:YidH family protein n=1 Tax=Camelliibacillus cellulosilyticus TaxID=2174486 RepID=A0ABV9GM50_9BACL